MESRPSVTNDLAHYLAMRQNIALHAQSHGSPSTLQQTHHNMLSTQCVCFQCQQSHATRLPRAPTPTTSSLTTLQHVQHVGPQYAYSEDRVQRVFQTPGSSYPVMQATHVQTTHAPGVPAVHDTIHGLAVAIERSVDHANARIEKLESTVSALSHFLLEHQAQGMQPTRIDPASHTSQVRREESVPPPVASLQADIQERFAELPSRLEVETLFAKLMTAIEKIIPITNVSTVAKHEIGVNTSSSLSQQYSDAGVQSGVLDTIAVGIDARPLLSDVQVQTPHVVRPESIGVGTPASHNMEAPIGGGPGSDPQEVATQSNDAMQLDVYVPPVLDPPQSSHSQDAPQLEMSKWVPRFESSPFAGPNAMRPAKWFQQSIDGSEGQSTKSSTPLPGSSSARPSSSPEREHEPTPSLTEDMSGIENFSEAPGDRQQTLSPQAPCDGHSQPESDASQSHLPSPLDELALPSDILRSLASIFGASELVPDQGQKSSGDPCVGIEGQSTDSIAKSQANRSPQTAQREQSSDHAAASSTVPLACKSSSVVIALSPENELSTVSLPGSSLPAVSLPPESSLPAESSPSGLLQPKAPTPVSSSLDPATSTSATSTGSSTRRSTLPLPRRTQLPKVPPASTPVRSFDDLAPPDWDMSPLTSPETSPVSRLPLPRSNIQIRKRRRTEIETTRSGSVGVEIRKTRRQTADLTTLLSRGSNATHYVWPTRKATTCVDQRKFVQCDNCKAWYHFACVDLTDEDSKLEDEFCCPPCTYSPADRERRASITKKSSQACGRPDCNCPESPSDKNEYFIERIIGRKPYVLRQGPRQNNFEDFLWLVKWEGYPVSRATWTLPDDLGKGDELIEQFMDAAKAEALDLSDPQRTIVLTEAALVGW